MLYSAVSCQCVFLQALEASAGQCVGPAVQGSRLWLGWAIWTMHHHDVLSVCSVCVKHGLAPIWLLNHIRRLWTASANLGLSDSMKARVVRELRSTKFFPILNSLVGDLGKHSP